ncbi:MAG: MarR family transcriptional regulator [Acidimicrobiales bacterium]
MSCDQPTAPDTDPVVLARLVFEVAASLRRAAVPAVERDYGLPQQSLDVLLRLSQADGGQLRMTDLAALTMLTPSGLTRAVDRLCAAGLVRRQACAHDRRSAFASLTGEGTARVHAAMSCHRTTLAQLLAEALEPSEQDRLAGLLVQLLEHLGARPAPGPASWTPARRAAPVEGGDSTGRLNVSVKRNR